MLLCLEHMSRKIHCAGLQDSSKLRNNFQIFLVWVVNLCKNSFLSFYINFFIGDLRYLTVSKVCFYFLFLNLKWVFVLKLLGSYECCFWCGTLISPSYEEDLCGCKNCCRHLNWKKKGISWQPTLEFDSLIFWKNLGNVLVSFFFHVSLESWSGGVSW